jgi:hypothetical protein
VLFIHFTFKSIHADRYKPNSHLTFKIDIKKNEEMEL